MNEDNQNTYGHQQPQMTVEYEDANFRCKIISNNDTFISETLVDFFNEQTTAKELADLLSGVTLPPGVQEKVDIIVAKIKANTEKVKKSLDDNKEST